MQSQRSAVPAFLLLLFLLLFEGYDSGVRSEAGSILRDPTSAGGSDELMLL